MRGKAGNSVFVQTKLGTVMRDRTQPTGAATPAQLAIRNNMRLDGAAWQALTAQEVAAWNAYAAKVVRKGKKSGKPYSPTGYQEFTALTTKFLQITPGGTVPVLPPTTDFGGDPRTVAFGAGTGLASFTISGANTPGTQTELLLQVLKGANRKPEADGYRSIGFADFTHGSLLQQFTVAPGHYAAAYRFVRTATGQETALVPIGTGTVTLAVVEGGAVEAPVASKLKKAA